MSLCVFHIFVETRFSLTLKLIFQPFVTHQMSLCVFHIFVERRFSITLKLIFQPFVTHQMSLCVFHIFVERRFSLTLKLKFKPFCDQPDVTSCSSHFRWNTVLINPQIEISTFLWPTKCHFIFFIKKSKQKSFHHIWKPLHRNHLNFFRMSLLWIDVKMISVFGIALKFQKFCMKTTPCQTFLHIASSPNPNWIFGGMIKLRAIKNIW